MNASSIKMVLIAVLAAWPVLAPEVIAQVRPVGQAGTALDASPRLGGGGYNAPVPRRYPSYGAGFGNLFITGNVTAGKSFQGFIPYSDPTQFQGGLGSDRLSDFTRDTVSLRRLSGRSALPAWQPVPYYNPSSTILPLSARRRNLAVPGGSTPRTGTITPEQFSTGVQLPRPEPQQRPVPRRRLPEGIRPEDILVPSEPLDLQALQIPLPAAEPNLPRAERPVEEPTEPIKTPTEAPGAMARPPLQPEQPRALGLFERLKAAAEERQLKQRQEQEDRSFRVIVGPQRELAESALRMAAEAAETTQPAPATRPELSRPSTQGAGRLRTVSTLAGNAGGPFNQQMRAAEQLIRHGKYRRAMDAYARAAQFRPQDPLPLLGRANAAIAAGYFRTAAEALYAALSRFPQVLQFKFDGDRLLGGDRVLGGRRLELQEIAQRREQDAMALLLLGYVELLGGDRTAGREWFEKAAQLRPDDNLLGGLPALVAAPAPPTVQPGD